MIIFNIIIVLIIFILSLILGDIIHYYIGKLKCKHEWEKISYSNIIDKDYNVVNYKIVYKCKKCGKRKVTKV